MREPIRRLSPYIATLIAAGEVIKRPEDIVRELIDNSIDAGANHITISIAQGGLETIQVKDNGSGIPKDELALALMHHATNKIQMVEDIEQVKTLGFRGEALASISAVARIKLASRTEDNLHGWEVTTQPNQPSLPPKPVAHAVGTSVSVTDLFHHIPARRRFLRTASTEFSRIHHWVKCLCLNHANVAFNLEHNKRSILQCTTYPNVDIANHRLARLATLYNNDFATVAIPITQKETLFSLSGWISPPDLARGQPDWQHFYVNGRLIKDKTINHAIKQAYKDVLYRDRHPIVVLFLNVDGTEVDFNVHPAKAEVRFRKTQLIFEFIYKAIQQALSKPRLSSSNTHKLPDTVSNPNEHLLDEAISSITFSPKPYSRPIKAARQHILAENQAVFSQLTKQPVQADFNDVIHPHEIALSNHSVITPTSLGHPLAQLHGTYILAQNQRGLVIIDTHAAHERVLYEQLKQSFTQNTPHKQGLLVPIILKLNAREIELIQLHHDVLEKIGFEYKTSHNEMAIEAVPQLLTNTGEDLIRDVISDLAVNSLSMRLEDQRNHLLSTMACRQAIHANRLMSINEMEKLLRLIEDTPHGGQCNHGRPTVREISLDELDKWFLRGK